MFPLLNCWIYQTRVAKPVLGKYYREPEKSGPLPVHLFGILMRSLRVDHFVSDVGEVVYYQSDPELTENNHQDWILVKTRFDYKMRGMLARNKRYVVENWNYQTG